MKGQVQQERSFIKIKKMRNTNSDRWAYKTLLALPGYLEILIKFLRRRLTNLIITRYALKLNTFVVKNWQPFNKRQKSSWKAESKEYTEIVN